MIDFIETLLNVIDFQLYIFKFYGLSDPSYI